MSDRVVSTGPDAIATGSTTPAGGESLGARERLLLAAEKLDAPGVMSLCVRSRLRIDAGRWWRKTPVWVGLTQDELVLFAVARRRYLERIPLAACRKSHYAHTTGELVLAPVEGAAFSRIAMSPRQAIAILRLMLEK